ncbi:hypothetical protein GQ53DRAFT_843805 [Thozetella sp. PMI_491]|nr:hypothetical protein GQ53DRAFT_843805 [Thozetella sp. PMI_491]
MDPLSLMASVAGVAQAGISLSSALFDLISALRSAPQDMAEMARGVSDLSLVLDHLTSVLGEGRQIYRRKLLGALESAIQRIDGVHDEIWKLVDAGTGNMARVRWVFRRSKTAKLLFKIEAHKSTLQIMTTTLLLAVEQRKYQSDNKGSERMTEAEKPQRSTRRRLRRRAETLVQSAHQTMREFVDNSEEGQEEGVGISTIEDSKDPVGGKTIQSGPGGDPDQDQLPALASTDGQMQPYEQPDDTGLWLYRMVFKSFEKPREEPPSSNPDDSKALVLRETQALSLVVSRRAKTGQVVDDLLWDWTRLSSREIRETAEDDVAKRPGAQDGERLEVPNLDGASSTKERTRSRASSGASVGDRPQASSKMDVSDRTRERDADRPPRREDVRRSPRRAADTQSSADHTHYQRTGEGRRGDGPEKTSSSRRLREEVGSPTTRSGSPPNYRLQGNPRSEPQRGEDDRYNDGNRRRDDRPRNKPRSESESYPSRPPPPRVEETEDDDENPIFYAKRDGNKPRRDSEDTNRVQKAAMAALIAGATEAFRASRTPGSNNDVTKRALTAALGAASIDAGTRPSSDNRGGSNSRGRQRADSGDRNSGRRD